MARHSSNCRLYEFNVGATGFADGRGLLLHRSRRSRRDRCRDCRLHLGRRLPHQRALDCRRMAPSRPRQRLASSRRVRGEHPGLPASPCLDSQLPGTGVLHPTWLCGGRTHRGRSRPAMPISSWRRRWGKAPPRLRRPEGTRRLSSMPRSRPARAEGHAGRCIPAVERRRAAHRRRFPALRTTEVADGISTQECALSARSGGPEMPGGWIALRVPVTTRRCDGQRRHSLSASAGAR